MLITTLLGALVARSLWNWPVWRVATLFGLMLLVDLAFVAGNATKIASGGWVPLALAGLMFAMFITWRDGRQRLRAELEDRAVSIKKLPELLAPAAKVPGTAVFLVSHSGFVPTALLRNLEHNKVHHEQIVILHIEIQRVPRIDPMCRVIVEELMPDVYDVRARFGFMETPDVGEALRNARRQGLKVFAEDSSFFLGWHLVRARPRPGFPGLKSRAFAFLQRRSAQAAEFFNMPTRGVVVLATEIELVDIWTRRGATRHHVSGSQPKNIRLRHRRPFQAARLVGFRPDNVVQTTPLRWTRVVHAPNSGLTSPRSRSARAHEGGLVWTQVIFRGRNRRTAGMRPRTRGSRPSSQHRSSKNQQEDSNDYEGVVMRIDSLRAAGLCFLAFFAADVFGARPGPGPAGAQLVLRCCHQTRPGAKRRGPVPGVRRRVFRAGHRTHRGLQFHECAHAHDRSCGHRPAHQRLRIQFRDLERRRHGVGSAHRLADGAHDRGPAQLRVEHLLGSALLGHRGLPLLDHEVRLRVADGRALSFSDFEDLPFCDLAYNDATPNANPNLIPDKANALFTTRCTVPARSGRHVIYAEWGRTPPTLERFHGCIDAAVLGQSAAHRHRQHRAQPERHHVHRGRHDHAQSAPARRAAI